jgi:phage baseplate assembly protein W
MALETSAHTDAQGTNVSDKTVKIWKDLNLNFTKHPLTNDVSRVYDVEAIKRSVKNLILTDYGERPFQPWIGSNIRALLFENVDALTVSSLVTQIELLLENFEPRVVLEAVDVDEMIDSNAIKITIQFTLTNSSSGEVYTLDTFLDKLK